MSLLICIYYSKNNAEIHKEYAYYFFGIMQILVF